MNVTIENTSTLPLALSACSGGKEVLHALMPGEAFTVNEPGIGVLNLGHNPNFLEELQDAGEAFLDGIKRLLQRIAGEAQDRGADPTAVTVLATITNHGPNELRVLLGSNLDEHLVGPGDVLEGGADAYIEVRELGV